MLYECWRQIARSRASEMALCDVASGRRWTFATLAAEAERSTSTVSDESVVQPTGRGAEFVLATLQGWRAGAVVCPLEVGAPPIKFGPLPKGIAQLKCTSATTGRPRMVAFTGEQLAADARNIVATMGLRPDWPNVGVISLAHSYGFSNLILPLLLHGIPLVLLDSPLPESKRRGVEEFGAITLPAVPALWRTWHDSEILSDRIRLAISAGAPLPLTLERAIFERDGLKVHNFYGATECGGIAYDGEMTPRLDEAVIGAPMKGVDLRIGSHGCLEVRGPAVGSGYWPDVEPALAVGCFRTTDLAEIEEGVVRLRGRAGDLINVAGRKVSPEVIEQALREHDNVQECLVFGVPSADLGRGDLIVAVVVARSERDESTLREHLQGRLPAWQIPKDWQFLDSLQPNQRGKLSRPEWRARLGYVPAN